MLKFAGKIINLLAEKEEEEEEEKISNNLASNIDRNWELLHIKNICANGGMNTNKKVYL